MNVIALHQYELRATAGRFPFVLFCGTREVGRFVERADAERVAEMCRRGRVRKR